MKIKNSIILVILVSCFYSCKQTKNEIEQNKIMNNSQKTNDTVFLGTPLEKLSVAVKDEDLDLITELVNKNQSLLSYKEPQLDYTILYWAVYYDKYNSTKKLLELGADPNLRSYKGKTPFIIACNKINTSAYTKLFIEFGANINDTIDSAPFKTPLIAASEVNLESTKLLVENGANIDVYFPDVFIYRNALHATNSFKKIEIARYLIIDNNADVGKVLVTTVKGEKRYFLDSLKEFYFKDSTKNKLKQELINYIETNKNE